MPADSRRVCFIDNGSSRGSERYTVERTFYRRIVERKLLPDAPVRIERHSDGEPMLTLTTDGQLTVFREYAWDGPSGPAPDIRQLMRGSLVHDVMYQLLREGRFFALATDHRASERRHDRIRKAADGLLRRMCRTDGLNRALSRVVWAGVRAGGGYAARRKGGFVLSRRQPEECAP